MFRIFQGHRTPEGNVTVTVNGKPLNPRHDVRNHSPDGFNWGYGGSGPAQLALAILCEVMGVAEATKDGLYQDFKFKVIGAIKGDTWTLDEHDVINAVEEIWNGK